MSKLKPCPFCGSGEGISVGHVGKLRHKSGCFLAPSTIFNSISRPGESDKWNTRATEPLMDQLKAELNRLYTKIDEDRFAALADDSVPRLVFNAAIEAIANKDVLLKKMAEALEELDDMFDPTSRVGEIINKALPEYRERQKPAD